MPAQKKKKAPPSSSSRAQGAPNAAEASIEAAGIELMSYTELLERKSTIHERLAVISIPDAPKKLPKISGSGGGKRAMSLSGEVTEIPFVPKTDTHWDFVMKGE